MCVCVCVCATDVSVCLDQILIQLEEVAPDWRRLAEAVGIEGVNDIAEYVRQTMLFIPWLGLFSTHFIHTYNM